MMKRMTERMMMTMRMMTMRMMTMKKIDSLYDIIYIKVLVL